MRAPRVVRGALVLLLALVLGLGSIGARAQDAASAVADIQQVAPDYEAWAEMARQAEILIADPGTSKAELETLRSQLGEQRQIFLAVEGENRSRIDRIQRQIDSLGAPPADGVTEPEAVATRRATLNGELDDLQAPGLRASEAYVAADGLVGEIDTVLRDRQTREILHRFPAPANPFSWAAPLAELGTYLRGILPELLNNVAQADQRLSTSDGVPGAVLLLVSGVILLVRGSGWVARVERRVLAMQPTAPVLLLRAVLSLVQLAVPTVGLVAVLSAIEIAGLAGDAGSALIYALGGFALPMIVGLWLIRRLFPRAGHGDSPLGLGARKMAKGRARARLMVIALSVYVSLDQFAVAADLSQETRAFLSFGPILLVAVCLYRVARLFRARPLDDGSARAASDGGTQEDAIGFSAAVLNALAALTMWIAIAGVLAGLGGYLTLAERSIGPAAITFFVFGLMAMVQQVFTGLYGSVSNARRPQEESLAPTLFGVVLILAALPVLALLWGAQPNDLIEMWAKVRTGFMIGDIRISPDEVLAFIVVFLIGLGLTWLVQGALRTTILPKTRIDRGGRTAIVSGVGYIGIFLAGLIAITTAGIDLSSLAILASALAVGVGFGLQTIVSNFVSGIILLIERPVSEGDWIEVGGKMGYVRAISVRSTRIETFDRTDVIVPNADLISNQVTNWTRGNLIGRVIIPVGVAYGSDTRKVEAILNEIVQAHPMVVLSPPPAVLFRSFGASELQFEIRAILRDINFMVGVQSDINHEIVRRFAEEGIEIPFPQRDLWLRNPEALSRSNAGTATFPAQHGAVPSAYREPPGADPEGDD
ncbi:MAG: DUF3772 domain-containing protein [Qingshengfaniella sp.]